MTNDKALDTQVAEFLYGRDSATEILATQWEIKLRVKEGRPVPSHLWTRAGATPAPGDEADMGRAFDLSIRRVAALPPVPTEVTELLNREHKESRRKLAADLVDTVLDAHGAGISREQILADILAGVDAGEVRRS